MKTIFKYKLELTDNQILELPYDYQILDIQVQNDFIYLWALVDNSNMRIKMEIFIIGTGNPFPSYANEHLGTVQMNNFVWHVFKD